MRPRHYDRFVLIGLCWLYGRGEFPPPHRSNRNARVWLAFGSYSRLKSHNEFSGADAIPLFAVNLYIKFHSVAAAQVCTHTACTLRSVICGILQALQNQPVEVWYELE